MNTRVSRVLTKIFCLLMIITLCLSVAILVSKVYYPNELFSALWPDASPTDSADSVVSQSSALPVSVSDTVVSDSEPPLEETAIIGESGLILSSTDGEYTDEQLSQITEFYSSCVFIGDSITHQFRSYTKQIIKDEVFENTKFLSAVSFSLINAFKNPNDENSVQIPYQGVKDYVWNSVAKMDVDRVFLCFWANELGVSNLESVPARYIKLIENIREKSPDVQIYIISPCYMYNSFQGRYVNFSNENITMLQDEMRAYCSDSDTHYVELSKYLGDEANGQYEEYSSDHQVHMSYAALDVWRRVLKDYAIGIETPIEDFPVPAVMQAPTSGKAAYIPRQLSLANYYLK